jgi:putative redox protein
LEETTWPIQVTWQQGLRLVGADESGHRVTMDVPKANGGDDAGFSPRKLLLASLAGCTAMDIVAVLRKERQELTGLQVFATGEENPLHPHYFTEIRLKYALRGRHLSEEAVRKAIALSDEKYCSVGANLKGRSQIHTEYVIVEDSAPAAPAGG